MAKPSVGIIMGSQSDWETMKHAVETLEKFKIECEVKVVSAHRTPDLFLEYIESVESRGIKVIIAGAGGAAHLPGVAAAKTCLPVLGVPMESQSLKGLDSLLSIVQMPAGVPVATFAIGKAGVINAAIFAASILGLSDSKIFEAVKKDRADQAKAISAIGDPRAGSGSKKKAVKRNNKK